MPARAWGTMRTAFASVTQHEDHDHEQGDDRALRRRRPRCHRTRGCPSRRASIRRRARWRRRSRRRGRCCPARARCLPSYDAGRPDLAGQLDASVAAGDRLEHLGLGADECGDAGADGAGVRRCRRAIGRTTSESASDTTAKAPTCRSRSTARRGDDRGRGRTAGDHPEHQARGEHLRHERGRPPRSATTPMRPCSDRTAPAATACGRSRESPMSAALAEVSGRGPPSGRRACSTTSVETERGATACASVRTCVELARARRPLPRAAASRG